MEFVKIVGSFKAFKFAYSNFCDFFYYFRVNDKIYTKNIDDGVLFKIILDNNINKIKGRIQFMKNNNISLNRYIYIIAIILFFIFYFLQTYDLTYSQTNEKQEYIEKYKPNITTKP
jgi:hypothetical protein